MRVKLIKRKTDLLIYLFLGLQVALWYGAKKYKPELSIVPNVPSTLSIKAISLGDEQFYFRTLAWQLQNAGDSFGRFTALREYNYNQLYHWFKLLDTLDMKSNFVPSLAGYYYSQTQNVPDVRYVINYLDENASLDLANKWWWMAQAVYLANNRLGDKKLALKLAYKLASTPEVQGKKLPLWARQMPAFIHEQMGEEDQSLLIIAEIVKNYKDIDPGEMNFMHYFVTERLKTIEKLKKEGKLEEHLQNLFTKYPELKSLIEHDKSYMKDKNHNNKK